MHCKKCLHYEVCVKLGKPSLYGINQEIGCSAYKDKEKWAEKKDAITNADRLRSMSDEELAEFLIDLTDDGNLRIREWLKQPAEERRCVMSRISKDAYYLEIAKAVAMRSTCLRRQYGAVIVKNDRIISTGYNGSARGEPNCCDVGECWRESHGIPHGEQYEKCVAVHAEDNAISQAGREAIGATLYLAGFENGKSISAVPCAMCERKIKNAQIHEVIT